MCGPIERRSGAERCQRGACRRCRWTCHRDGGRRRARGDPGPFPHLVREHGRAHRKARACTASRTWSPRIRSSRSRPWKAEQFGRRLPGVLLGGDRTAYRRRGRRSSRSRPRYAAATSWRPIRSLDPDRRARDPTTALTRQIYQPIEDRRLPYWRLSASTSTRPIVRRSSVGSPGRRACKHLMAAPPTSSRPSRCSWCSVPAHRTRRTSQPRPRPPSRSCRPLATGVIWLNGMLTLPQVKQVSLLSAADRVRLSVRSTSRSAS